MKKFMNPKWWLIVTGLIHAAMGVGLQTVMAADVAVMGWGADNLLGREPFYEFLFGLFIIPHVAVMFASAFWLEGVAQAKMTAVLGVSITINFIAAAIHASGHGYMEEMGAAAAFAPPIIMFAGLALSGILHSSDADGASSEG